jgi:hypothetical protein
MEGELTFGEIKFTVVQVKSTGFVSEIVGVVLNDLKGFVFAEDGSAFVAEDSVLQCSALQEGAMCKVVGNEFVAFIGALFGEAVKLVGREKITKYHVR